MRRLILIAAGAAALAALAFAAIVINTGGRPDSPMVGELAIEHPAEAPAEGAGEDVPTADGGSPTPQPLAAELDQVAMAPLAEDDAARATFEEMARSLMAFGLDISADTVGFDGDRMVARGLEVAGPEAPTRWRWEMAEASLQPGEGGSFAVTTSGPQTVMLADAGVASVWSGRVERMDIDVEVRPGAEGGTVQVALSGLSLQGASAALPVSLATGRLGFDVAAGSGAVSRVELSDLVLPSLAGEPFGTRVKRVDARVDLDRPGGSPAAPDLGLEVPNVELEWGTLQLTGDGSVGLDAELRPAGRFQVRLANVLAALDAVQATRPFDRDVLAETYASLLYEMAARPAGEAMPFTIEIGEGKLVLSGAEYGFGDIELARVPPLRNARGPGQATP